MTSRLDDCAVPEPVPVILEKWEDNPYHSPEGDEPGWEFGIGRRSSLGNQLCAVFCEGPDSSFPKGYRDSLVQRFDLLRRAVPLTEKNAYWLEEKNGGALELWCPYCEGESLLSFIGGRREVGDDLAFELIGDLVDVLIRFVKFPRLLSGLTLDDFRVCVRDGVRLECKGFVAPSLFRREKPKSDFQIASEWIGIVARMYVAVRSGWKGHLSSHDPFAARPFRKMLRDLGAGKERSLIDRMVGLRKVIFSEVSAPAREGLEARAAWENFPSGILSSRLFQGLDEVQCDVAERDKMPPRFSHFAVEAGECVNQKRVCYLVPADDWVGVPIVDTLNRKMSHSFLQAHHNGIRARSVLCRENCTALLTDLPIGVPLPSLLRFRGGLNHEEFMFLLQKIHRALGQFESADFLLDLRSPWQLQLHLEEGRAPSNWRDILSMDIRSWPSWDIRVRVELPMEYMFPSRNSPSWAFVFERLGEKFFPALVCWIMGWERFELAWDTGVIASEPLSRDERFDAFFQAARKFLEATDIGQRENFLRMVDEGVRGSLRGQT